MMGTTTSLSAREALLQAFDQLFDYAADKLRIRVTEEEKEKARRDFAERTAAALEIIDKIQVEAIPTEVMQHMRDTIDGLSPAQVVGYVAALPLVRQTHELVRQIAYRAAEQRLVEQLIDQADDTYGGN